MAGSGLFSAVELDVLDTVVRFSSVLSILGCLGIMVSFFSGDRKRSGISQIVFSLCFKDFLGAIFTFMGRYVTATVIIKME
jgi:hypothetical protein